MEKHIELDIEQLIADFTIEIPDEAEGWYTLTRISEIAGLDRKKAEYMMRKYVENGIYEAHPDNPVGHVNYFRRVGN